MVYQLYVRTLREQFVTVPATLAGSSGNTWDDQTQAGQANVMILIIN